MAKAPDAFRTISEVAESLDTPAHVLRFWESKFTQVKPVKRAGGRRYYRPDDVALLGGIKVLLHDQGLTIKGAQKVLRDSGLKAVMNMADTDQTFDSSSDLADSGDIIDLVANTVPADETVREIAPRPQSLPEPQPIATPPAADKPDHDAPAQQDVARQDVVRQDVWPESIAQPNIVLLQTAIPPHTMPAAASRPLPDLPPVPAPRPAAASRVLQDLARADRAALARSATKIAPVLARLAQLHSRMTAG
ncbi:MerR family transcriptional regulator [Loktanella salsilacus]|uniref:MerR family transcriptional regulator n=1 Tax=Loktanella salsilacus TaxID=195913 RepID=UPI0037352686